MPISVTIIESPLKIIAGIPSNITFETNIPSTIFYTLDSTEPDENSPLALGPIQLPTDVGFVIVKVFATNGVDSSPIITQFYGDSISAGRRPHDTVDLGDTSCKKATFPFGSPAASLNPKQVFGNTGGQILDDGQPPRATDGYDGTATNTGVGFFTPPKSQYSFLFSETNYLGERGRGLGTLPAKVISSKPRNDNNHPQSTNTASPLFNPRALVIFQDSREEQFDKDIPRINRPYFDLENSATARDGALLTSSDSITPSGGFLKAHYNPTENTLTYYYYDNRTARWIISKEPYSPSSNPTVNMAGMVTRRSRDKGVGFVFKWIPFQRRHLI
jgi:hypothetical protein